jgi:hypothetical protein
MLTDRELIVDSWEQARERPEDNQEQKKYYSGKKKQHTFKGQVITLPLGEDIVDIEVGKQGKASDINLFREQQKKFDTIFRIAKERFRMKGDKYEQIILTVCGLVRLRIGALILPN